MSEKRSDSPERAAHVADKMKIVYGLTDTLRMAIEIEYGGYPSGQVGDEIAFIEQAVERLLENAYLAGQATALNESVLALQVEEAFVSSPEE